jgi:hypothetical protein
MTKSPYPIGAEAQNIPCALPPSGCHEKLTEQTVLVWRDVLAIHAVYSAWSDVQDISSESIGEQEGFWVPRNEEIE